MSESIHWSAGASLTNLQYRALIVRRIRAFFDEMQILEVTTPLLGVSTVADLHIQSFSLKMKGEGDSDYSLYLQTSPEFFMKRLLAMGSGPIYQLCQAFRSGESGSLHNPEFTLLEWYRPGFEQVELMDEVEALLGRLSDSFPGCKRVTYREMFESRLNINPHAVATDNLISLCQSECKMESAHWQTPLENRTRENCLDLLFSQCIQPGLEAPCFVTEFPASQAALAKTAERDNDQVALRFELYWGGVELANGYTELTDADELSRRIDRDNSDRHALGLPILAPDEKLLQAMRDGLPASCGVAMGLDRLLMVLSDVDDIDKILCFSISRL